MNSSASKRELDVHMSLEEVIQRRRSSNKSNVMGGVNPMEALKMSLDQIIQKRKQEKAKQENNKASSSSGVVSMIIDDEDTTPPSTSRRIGSDWNKSLDEIIKERQIRIPGKALSHYQTVRRTPGVKRTMDDLEAEEASSSQDSIGGHEEQYIVSPIDVIRNLGDLDGLMIHQSIGINPEWTLTSDRGDRWQSLISCGLVSVKVNATYKELARQAAAMGMIGILKELHPMFPYPKNCKISEAYFYDLRYTVKCLIDMAAAQGFPVPSYHTIHSRRDKRDFFITIVSIGKDDMQGSSYDEGSSVLLGLRAAYETYALRPLFRGTYKVVQESREGNESNEDFRLRESETLHTISINVEMLPPPPPAKFPRVSPQ